MEGSTKKRKLAIFVLLIHWVLVVNATEQVPQFTSKFPNVFDFSNTTGGKLICSTNEESGAKINWLLSDGSPVFDIGQLRRVLSDGSLTFSPFGAEEYRQDVHAISYRCAASNSLGTLVSNEIKVKGVVSQAYDVHVYDVYAIIGNVAVMRCHIPKFLNSFVTVTAWIKDSVISITPGNFNSDSKYIILPTGELIINNIDSNDADTSYRCRVSNRLTKEIKTSVNPGRIIVTESKGKVPPKIVFTQPEIFAKENDTIVIPCVGNGLPVPIYSWQKQTMLQKYVTIKIKERYKMILGSLVIEKIQKSDEGNYICTISNEENGDTTITQVVVLQNLKVAVIPQQATVDIDNSLSISCKVSGFPVTNIFWTKDGNQLAMSDVIQTNNETIYISKMQVHHAGIYQCFVQNDLYSSFETAIVKLGETLPTISNGFEEKVVNPGQSIELKCTASGNPIPQIHWTLDNIDLHKQEQIHIFVRETGLNEITSIIKITNIKVEDGGVYRCSAISKKGQSTRAKRINVIGKIGIRDNVKVLAVEDEIVQIDCPVYGYPLQSIEWERNNEIIPINMRQAVYANGTLTILNVHRHDDDGQYICKTTGNQGQEIYSEVELTVMVPPKITPFNFPEDLIREGARARVQCVVSEGQSPLKLSWLKDGQPLFQGEGVTLHNLDEFSSILMINFINPKHNGNYTCLATNKAGTTQQSARLFVNDDQFFKGMRAHIVCAVSQGDLPIKFEWLKDGHPIKSSMGINTRDYDGHANSLSIESVSSIHSGNYTCTASNQAATVFHTIQLLVQVVPKITPFNFHNNLLEGNFARVSCIVFQGDLPLRLQWFKDNIPAQNVEGVFVKQFDDYSSILTIDAVQTAHSGNYTCIAKNSADEAKYTAQLLVHVPPKIVPFAFQEKNLQVGMLVRVSCIVSRGDLPLTIKWLKDGEAILTDLAVTLRVFDEYSSVLSIDPVSTEHSGNYSCIAQNHAGVDMYSSKLSVQVRPKWITKFSNKIVRTGETLNLDCEAEGFPKPIITWRRVIGSGNLREESEPVIGDNNQQIYPNGSLAFFDVQRSHEGMYICIANNGIGKPLSKIISLKIQAAPEFDQVEHEIKVKKGEEIKIKCSASGNWPISYQWSVNDYKIDDSKGYLRYKIEDEQDKTNQKSTSYLIINWVDRKDSTVFTCFARNEIGESQSNIKLIVQELPEAPVITEPINVLNQTVELNWTLIYDGNSKIIEYIIQYKKDVDRWSDRVNTLTIPSDKKLARISNLKPATLYSFRILAANSIGNGSFSNEVTAKTEETEPQGAPENIDVESTDANTLRVMWKPPKKNLWNGAICGYNIGFRVHESQQEYTFYKLEVPEDYTEELIYQLTNLNMYTQYDVVVQAYNSKGNGPISEDILAMTSEDVPSSAPENIRCSSLSSTSIYVLWEAPIKETINGILRGYKVLYKPVDEWYDSLTQSKIASLSKITLNELEVHTNYSIQVLAFTKMGDGVKSPAIFCKTHEDVPYPPETIKVLPSSTDSVVVAWKPPKRANGALIKYNIYYKEMENGQQIDEHAQNTEQLMQDAKIYQSQINNHHVELKGLQKDKKYAFWVTASSAIGESSGSTVVAQTVADSIVAAKSASFDSVIKTPWKEDVVMPCFAVGFPTPNRKWTFGTHQLKESSRLKIGQDGSVIINKVSAEDSGNYTCAVYNEYGHDTVSYLVAVEVPPSAPILDVVSKTRTSIKLQWRNGIMDKNNIRGYFLHFKQDNGNWNIVELRSDHSLHTLSKLACGPTYKIFMEAFNHVGTGAPSDTISVTTEGSDISSPPKDAIIREGSTFITVNLDTWPSTGCPVKKFAVAYKQLSSHDWISVDKNISPTQKKLIISSLSPATWYILRVTVDTASTPTFFEYKFATHTVTGGTIAPDTVESFAPVYIFYLDPLIFIPAVALLIVIVIACVVVCVYVKRRNGSVGTPSDVYDNGNEMNTWIRHTNTLPHGHFGQMSMPGTLKSRYCRDDPSPYATSHLIGSFQHVDNKMKMGQCPMLQSEIVQNEAIIDGDYDPPPPSHMIRNSIQ